MFQAISAPEDLQLALRELIPQNFSRSHWGLLICVALQDQRWQRTWDGQDGKGRGEIISQLLGVNSSWL